MSPAKPKARTKKAPRRARPSPSTQKGRSTSAKDERKKAILRAAVKVFAEQGYHGCRISDVADEAGVAYGLVYHYFGNKDALLGEIFEQNWGFFQKALEQMATEAGTLKEQLRQIIDFMLNAYDIDPHAVKVMVVEFGRSNRIGDALDTPAMSKTLKFMQKMFEDGAERGELRDGIDPRSAVLILVGAVEVMLTSLLLHQSKAKRDIAAAKARETLHAIFSRGIALDKEES